MSETVSLIGQGLAVIKLLYPENLNPTKIVFLPIQKKRKEKRLFLRKIDYVVVQINMCNKHAMSKHSFFEVKIADMRPV